MAIPRHVAYQSGNEKSQMEPHNNNVAIQGERVSGPARLRFGVMCHASGLTEFARICIEGISDLATPVVLIVDDAEPRRSTWIEKLNKAVRLNGNLWYLHNRLFPINKIPSARTKPLEESLANVPQLRCAVTRKGKWSEYFSEQDIAAIRELRLDFILRFAYGIVRGGILWAAKYGVWSYHHDDEEKYRGGPPGFWEIYNGDGVTSAILQKINEKLDAGVVLKKICVPTLTTSYAGNLQRIQESSTHMVRWVCLDILNRRAQYLEAQPKHSQAPIYRAPNDLQILKFWWRLASNWVRYKLANQRVDDWNVGLVHAAPEELLHESYDPEIRWMNYREKHRMIADPCFVPNRNQIRILCEEFNWFLEKGRIVEICSAPDGSLSQCRPAIDEGVHMSYPYVFEHEGEIYCIPECAERREIALYRWIRDAKQWRRDSVLLEGIAAVDATVFQAHGSWWLFHSLEHGVGQWSLYIWTAEHLRGPWRPHSGNPVKTDVSSSRPAGKPFWYQGALYRPAQDGRNSYGGALALNRVESLSREDFREVTVRRIQPLAHWPYPDGIHTLNGFGGLLIIDAKRHRWPLDLIVKRWWYKRCGKAAEASGSATSSQASAKMDW